MGAALVRGVVRAGIIEAEHVFVTDVDAPRRDSLAEELQATALSSSVQLLEKADTIILAVKPQVMGDLLQEVASVTTPEHLFITVAAGLPLAFYEQRLCAQCRLVRVMPNTPSLLGCGAAAAARGRFATEEDMARALMIMRGGGFAEEVAEEKMNAVTGLSGSGPAYFFRMMEALTEAGQKAGLSEDLARKLTIQTALGAARMASETTRTPSELRKAVTSPGGTTEAGLQVMEEADFGEMINRVVLRARDRGSELADQLK